MAGEEGVTFRTQQKGGSPQNPSDCTARWDRQFPAASSVDEGGLGQEMKEEIWNTP